MNGWRIRSAVRLLEHGAILAYPTEGCYGLGCDPYNGPAVLRLLEIKRRPLHMGLVLIASNFYQLKPLLTGLPTKQAAAVQSTWPGPITWTWPCIPEVPQWLTGGRSTLAVRVTAHPLAAALCATFGGPLVSTSANIRGCVPANTAVRVRCIFGNQVDYTLHGELSGRKRPTEMRDARSGRVLRKG